MKDEVLESMNAKADNMRKTIVDILGEDIGKVDQSSVDTDTLKIKDIRAPQFLPHLKTVDAFKPRTCVKFHVENLEQNGYSEITYEADPIQLRVPQKFLFENRSKFFLGLFWTGLWSPDNSLSQQHRTSGLTV